MGIFPRSKKSSSKPGSGTATPSESAPKSAVSTSTTTSQTSKKSGEYEYDDDDDLPPREEEGDIGDLGYGGSGTVSPSVLREEEEAIKNIPKTAGFDFAAISKALGKEIDVDKLPVPPEARSGPAPTTTHVGLVVEDRPPLERSGSAPPSANRPEDAHADEDEGTPYNQRGQSKSQVPGQSRSFGTEGDDDDMGDIAGSTRDLSIHTHPHSASASTTDLPNWDRPITSPSPSPHAESLSPGIPTSSFGGFNAWSPSPSPSSPLSFNANGPLRSAPPARPHPPEFMANPFAAPAEEKEKEKKSEGGSGFGFGSWGKKADDPWSSSKKTGDDQWADKNPW